MSNINLNNLMPEFLSDILITAFDANLGACWYWAHPELGWQYEGDTWFNVSLREMGEDGPEGPILNVDHEKIKLGIQRIMSDEFAGEALTWYANLVLAVTNNDAGYIDADIADVIVQMALFEEIVYG